MFASVSSLSQTGQVLNPGAAVQRVISLSVKTETLLRGLTGLILVQVPSMIDEHRCFFYFIPLSVLILTPFFFSSSLTYFFKTQYSLKERKAELGRCLDCFKSSLLFISPQYCVYSGRLH